MMDDPPRSRPESPEYHFQQFLVFVHHGDGYDLRGVFDSLDDAQENIPGGLAVHEEIVPGEGGTCYWYTAALVIVEITVSFTPPQADTNRPDHTARFVSHDVIYGPGRWGDD